MDYETHRSPILFEIRVGAIELPLTSVWGTGAGLTGPDGATAALFATDRGEKGNVLLVMPTRARLDAD